MEAACAPNPKPLMVFQQKFSKPVLLNLPLFLTNYSRFPTLLAHFPPRGNKPTSFISQKIRRLIHSTIVPLQSFHSSLKLSRLSSLNNFLPSFKQTIFSLITSMAGDLLAYAVHVYSSALESSGESTVISLDISKAFDRV